MNGLFPEIFSPQTVSQIIFGSAVITAVINVTWFAFSNLLGIIVRWFRRREESHVFVLGEAITRQEYEELFRNISAFYCLLVRFGTDDYISKMADDRERYEGRQRLARIMQPIDPHAAQSAAFA